MTDIRKWRRAVAENFVKDEIPAHIAQVSKHDFEEMPALPLRVRAKVDLPDMYMKAGDTTYMEPTNASGESYSEENGLVADWDWLAHRERNGELEIEIVDDEITDWHRLTTQTNQEPSTDDALTEEELQSDGYRYKIEIDHEDDNSKIWHLFRAPDTNNWEIVDISPYVKLRDENALRPYIDFHKEHGRWPNQRETRSIDDMKHSLMVREDNMDKELRDILKLAGMKTPVAEAEDKDASCRSCKGTGTDPEMGGDPCNNCGGEGTINETKGEQRFRRGFTEVVLKKGMSIVTHTGNMGNTLRDVAKNVNSLFGPDTFINMRRNAVEEKGNPDYAYTLKSKFVPVVGEDVSGVDSPFTDGDANVAMVREEGNKTYAVGDTVYWYAEHGDPETGPMPDDIGIESGTIVEIRADGTYVVENSYGDWEVIQQNWVVDESETEVPEGMHESDNYCDACDRVADKCVCDSSDEVSEAMTRSEIKKARQIARSIYYGAGLAPGTTTKEMISLIQQEAGVSRRHAYKLYNELNTEDTVRYVTRYDEDLNEAGVDEDFLAPKKGMEDAEEDEVEEDNLEDSKLDEFAPAIAAVAGGLARTAAASAGATAVNKVMGEDGLDDIVWPEEVRVADVDDLENDDDEYDIFRDRINDFPPDELEEGPGDEEDEFEAPERILDVGDDEDFDDFDFDAEFEKGLGGQGGMYEMNELRKMAGLPMVEEEDVVEVEEDTEEESITEAKRYTVLNNPYAKNAKVKDTHTGEVHGPMTQGEANALCGRLNREAAAKTTRNVKEDSYSEMDIFTFDNEAAFYLVQDFLGPKLDFGTMDDEVLVPEADTDRVIALLVDNGFEPGEDFMSPEQFGMEEDLQNGYEDHHMVDGDDLFPQGATSEPAQDLGPGAGKQGDNPMRSRAMVKHTDNKIYESYKLAYRRFRRK